MSKTIKLLEDRVTQAVERLQTLAAERRTLEQELRETRTELEAALAEPAPTGTDPEHGVLDREHVLTAVRETLADLRAD